MVIHYAGHGSQMTDLEGDEPSGLDSTIMPFDTEGWQGDNRDITDDQIGLKLAALGEKTAYITLILRLLATRGRLPATLREHRVVRSRPIRRPASELKRTPTQGIGRGATPVRRSSGWMPMTEKYVLISGCRDEETSFEYQPPEGEGKISHGALTYFLSQQLKQATTGTTYRDIFERAAARVNAANNAQHPQMEGKADREIFGVREVVPTRFLRVTARDGATVTLSAGAAQGVTTGSVYAIHPQGTKDPAAPPPSEKWRSPKSAWSPPRPASPANPAPARSPPTHAPSRLGTPSEISASGSACSTHRAPKPVRCAR